MCLGFDVPDSVIREVWYVPEVEVVGNIRDLLPAKMHIEGARILDKLFEAKCLGWSYEEEVRVYDSREEIDEASGLYFLN